MRTSFRYGVAFIGGHNEQAPTGARGEYGYESGWWTGKVCLDVLDLIREPIAILHVADIRSHYEGFPGSTKDVPPFRGIVIRFPLLHMDWMKIRGVAEVNHASPWFLEHGYQPQYPVEALLIPDIGYATEELVQGSIELFKRPIEYSPTGE